MPDLVTYNRADFGRQLSQLGSRIGGRVLRSALRTGVRVFRDAVKARAPVKSGTLKRAIFIGRSRYSSRVEQIYRVGVRSGAKYGKARKRGKNRDAFYWPFVEKGHLARGPGNRVSGGRRRASRTRQRLKAGGARMVRARPFMKPAFDAADQLAFDAVERELIKGIREATR